MNFSNKRHLDSIKSNRKKKKIPCDMKLSLRKLENEIKKTRTTLVLIHLKEQQ